jgi:hypothetical protein
MLCRCMLPPAAVVCFSMTSAGRATIGSRRSSLHIRRRLRASRQSSTVFLARYEVVKTFSRARIEKEVRRLCARTTSTEW